jgi:hypothetical protein
METHATPFSFGAGVESHRLTSRTADLPQRSEPSPWLERRNLCMSIGLRRTRSWSLRTVATATLAIAAVAAMAAPAAAGGSWLRPVRDRYEPGETATLVGYVGPGGTLGAVEDGPFFAFLRRLGVPLTEPNQLGTAPFTPQASDLPLGELVVHNTGRPGYLAYRVSIQFRLPSALPAGRYGVIYCNSTCTKGLSDLIGGVVFVGTDPDGPNSREWPRDEPEISNLEDDAVLSGPGWQITARDARARPLDPVATSFTTAPATTVENAERTAHRASESNPADPGAWGWVLLAVCVMAIVGASGLIAMTRASPRR